VKLASFSREKINVIIYMMTDMLAKGIPFLLLPIYTAFLAPDQFGNIAIFNVIVEIAIIFVVFGANSYYRVEYFNTTDKPKLFSQLFKNILFTFPIAMLLQAIFVWSELNPGNQEWPWLFAAVIIALMQSVVLMFIAEFQSQGKALHVGAINLSSAVIVASITIVLLSFDFAEQARYWGFLIGSLSVAGIAWFGAKKLAVTPSFDNVKLSKPALSFGLGVLPHALSWWARTGMDRMIIAKFVSVYHVGLYSIAAQISLIVIVISNAVNQAFTPKFMQMLTEKKYRQSFVLCLKIIAIYLLVSVLLAMSGPLLFDWFINAKYHEALLLLPLMCVIALCQAIVTLLSNFLYFFKKVKILSIITSTTSFMHVVIAYLVVESYGINGIIISSIATYVVAATIILIVTMKLLKGEHHAQNQPI